MTKAAYALAPTSLLATGHRQARVRIEQYASFIKLTVYREGAA